MTTIVWFRQDLRLADNPALAEAFANGPVLPLYIVETPEQAGDSHPMTGASHWWLHHSLKALDADLGALGGRLVVMEGPAETALARAVAQSGATAIHWNRCYEPHAIARDKHLKTRLSADGLSVRSFNASLLHEPWDVETKTGGPFKVYSPFWRAALTRPVAAPLPRASGRLVSPDGLGRPLDSFGLTPSKPDWAAGWLDLWQPGEAGASALLGTFLEEGLKGYGELRNRPDLPNVSRLSICISARSRRGRSGPRRVSTPTCIPRSPRTARNSCPRSAGASLPITCSITSRPCLRRTGSLPSMPIPGAKARPT